MSHTFRRGAISYIYNSDYSGEIEINLPQERVVVGEENARVSVNIKELEAFILEKWRSELIKKIEQFDGPQLLDCEISDGKM